MRLYELLNLTSPTTAISLSITEKDGNTSYFSSIVSYVPITYCKYTINDLTTEDDMLLVNIEDKR